MFMYSKKKNELANTQINYKGIIMKYIFCKNILNIYS